MLAGQTLGGRYDVLELIASGGMGEVYRARDRELDELVALKVIRTDLADATMIERFRAEVKLARRVTHANVARTFELGHADGIMFCTMELVEGETLADRLARGQRLGVAEAVGIACAVCDALIAAHAANVIHRDIKPANILIATDGRPVLADFGIAAARVMQPADTAGTPAYMAPEQARGEPATPAADVYAVGVVLYEMLTGRRAFPGSLAQITETRAQVTKLVPSGGEISAELGDVVARATAASLEHRTASATELRRTLSPWATTDIAQPPRRERSHALDDRTVILIAPHATAPNDLMHVAGEIHEQLLATLGQSTLRVLPRTEHTLSEARLVVRFEVSDHLAMRVDATDAPAFTVALPLAVEQIARAVAIAAAAIHAAVGTKPMTLGTGSADVLLMQARQASRLGPLGTNQAIVLVERALAVRPDDPRIQALHAILLSRLAFFTSDLDGSKLRRAGEQIRAALASSPNLADAHLAAGHFELHTGDPTIAAGHYRAAIACSPYLAEAHEHLGRVLIESGYVEAAIARFDEAAAIAPQYTGAQWEIARAMALSGNWEEHDRIVGRTIAPGPITKARTAWWRRDMTRLAEARAETGTAFEGNLMRFLIDVFLEGSWAAVREPMIAKGLDESSPSRRRRVFVAQLVAETAGFAGDHDACLRMLEHATTIGLFDLHWLDHVPMLDGVRALPAYAAIRARVEARARGIYDALYGDHGIALTVPATS